MSDEPIIVNNKPFFGRVEEQKRFRDALREQLRPPYGETLPYVFLLYGDGGIGKTTLAQRFLDIVTIEQPFEGAFRTLHVDWQDERTRYAALQVGRKDISAEAVFGAIHAAALRNGWGKFFGRYHAARDGREEAVRKATKELPAVTQRDQWAELQTLSAAGLAKLVRGVIPFPIGRPGEKLVEGLANIGIRFGVEQAARLRDEVEEHLRARLRPEHFNLFFNPHEQLALALAEGFTQAASGRPLVIVLDTYEIVDHADFWLRTVVQAAGPRLIWVIAGRNNLVRSRAFGDESFKGYAEDFPRRLIPYDMHQLAKDDIRDYFAEFVPDRPLGPVELQTIATATGGIPLVIREAADIWNARQPLSEIVRDVTPTMPRGQLVRAMTERYLMHCINNEADKRALYALALARGNVEVLHALLAPPTDTPFDLEVELRRLERDYASVYLERTRLHDEPALFFLEYLKEPVRRNTPWLKDLIRPAVAMVYSKRERLEANLPTLAERCADEDWVKTALDLTYYLFWLDEDEAWRWLIPRFVESLAYSVNLRRGLLKVAGDWKECLSAAGKRRLKSLDSSDFMSSSWLGKAEACELLDELGNLDRLRWLGGDGGAERRAILDWRRGQVSYREERYGDALRLYQSAAAVLRDMPGTLKKQLGQDLVQLARKLIWPDPSRSPIPTATGLTASELAAALDPTNVIALYQYAVALSARGEDEKAVEIHERSLAIEENTLDSNSLGTLYVKLGQLDKALMVLDRAIKLDPSQGASWNGLGIVYLKLGQLAKAIESFKESCTLSPETGAPWSNLGYVYKIQGRDDEAMAAFERACTLSPEVGAPWANCGALSLESGELDQAALCYQRAVELEPADGLQFYTELGVIALRQGKELEARGHFEAALATHKAAPRGAVNTYRSRK